MAPTHPLPPHTHEEIYMYARFVYKEWKLLVLHIKQSRHPISVADVKKVLLPRVGCVKNV